MNFGNIANIGKKAVDLFKTNYGQNTLQKDLSSGNKFFDVGLGALSGLSTGGNNKGWYMPTYNYMGNGLARSGMEYVQNRNSFNPYDASNAVSAVLNRGKGNSLFKLGNIFKRKNKGKIQDGFATGNTIQDFIGNEVNGQELQPETVMDYLQQETGYNGYIPQLLPYEFDERGGFDYNIG